MLRSNFIVVMIMRRLKLYTVVLLMMVFIIGLISTYYKFHKTLTTQDSNRAITFQIQNKAPTSHDNCVTLIEETITKLQSVQLHTDKLKLLQKQLYVDLPSQETCESICLQLPVLSKDEQVIYKPIGNLSVEDISKVSMDDLEQLHQTPVNGGGWLFKTNQNCSMVRKSGVAIVIVIRDRWTQLTNVLSTLIPLLRRQRLCYRIFVIEQYGQEPFNRGMLFNVGFMEAADRFQFDCVVFHDADLGPMNDLNPYGCDKETEMQPIHLGVGVDVRNFKLNYPDLIGGVLKLHNSHFVAVNGHSNLYWGWGQEDDDLATRLRLVKVGYYQMSPSIARYRAIPHEVQKKNGNPRKAHLYLLKKASTRMYFDGLTSLSYRVVKKSQTPLFTHLLVDLGKMPEFYDCHL